MSFFGAHIRSNNTLLRDFFMMSFNMMESESFSVQISSMDQFFRGRVIKLLNPILRGDFSAFFGKSQDFSFLGSGFFS